MSDIRPRKSHSHFLENDKGQTGNSKKFSRNSLWSTRFLVLFAVLASLAASLCLFLVGTFDVVKVFYDLVTYALGLNEKIDLHVQVIGNIIGSVDIFLIAVVLLIFSFGLYELFISPIDAASLTESSSILDIGSLDLLKDKIGHVIIMALIVKFFQIVLIMKVGNWLDLLILAGSIGLLALAMFLIHLGKKVTRDLD